MLTIVMDCGRDGACRDPREKLFGDGDQKTVQDFCGIPLSRKEMGNGGTADPVVCASHVITDLSASSILVTLEV